jgi:two-component system response regulator RegX3
VKQTAAAPVRVLVVEDAESFVEALVVSLEREGFQASVARDGIEALERFEQDDPDLILLDVMLPRMSGIDVCRAIRARSNVPIIMVTAKTTELDTVVGLEVGADDYVAKPYRFRELVSRMRAVLRRRSVEDGTGRAPAALREAEGTPARAGTGAPVGRGRTGGARPEAAPADATPAAGAAAELDRLRELTAEPEVLTAGEVTLDVGRHECIVRGAEVRLPLKEFEILEILLANAGRVVTRDSLIDRVWGLDYVGDTKTLDVHIKRLRSRIEVDPSNPALITTIRGVGYRFEAPRH